jgi:hypothetical protein|tara:strand:+ start:1285 stop:1485 length:201 start_codon:yes stop_codon:yes gene_type:complete
MINQMKLDKSVKLSDEQLNEVAAAGRKILPKKRPTSLPNIKNAKYKEYPRNDRPHDVGWPFWHWEF